MEPSLTSDQAGGGIDDAQDLSPQQQQSRVNDSAALSVHHRRKHHLNMELYVDFDDLSSDLVCVLCAEVLLRPIVTPCGHTFCESCLHQWFLKQRICPIDRNPLSPTQLKAHTDYEARIAALPLRCWHVDHGCNFTAPRSERDIHSQECPYRPTPCPHASSHHCPTILAFQDVSKHAMECPFRPTPCPHALRGCTRVAPFRDITSHAIECLFRETQCPHISQSLEQDQGIEKCGWAGDARDLPFHVAQCPFRPVPCPHAALGCKQVTLYSKISNHLAACPYEGLKSFLYESKHESMRLRQEIRQLRTQVYLLGKCARSSVNADVHSKSDKYSDILESMRNQQALYAESHTRLYINQPKLFRELDRFVLGSQDGLVLYGESGSGKSALLANWAYEYEARHPDVHVVCHFVRCSIESSSLYHLIRRLILEIRADMECKDEIPTDPQQLLASFSYWLERCSRSDTRIIIVLDGINLLDNSDNALEFLWIPVEIPPQVRLIISSVPGKCLDTLQKRSFRLLGMEPLSKTDQQSLAIEVVGYHGRELTPADLDLVSNASQCESPLFLKTALEEAILSSMSEYDLRAKLGEYLGVSDTSSLFQKVLERWERCYGEVFVKNFTSLIYCSHQGLKKEELLTLISYPQAQFELVLRETKDHFITRYGGTLNFSNENLRSAVFQRYLASTTPITPDSPLSSFETTLRRYLYRFFFNGEIQPRKVQECPHQAALLGDKQVIKECLSDLDVFLGLFTTDRKLELFRLWRECGGYNLSQDAYVPMFHTLARHSLSEPSLYKMDQIAFFMKDVGLYKIACDLFEKVLLNYQEFYGREHAKVADALINYGVILGILFKKRIHVFKEAIQIIEKYYGMDHIKLAKPLQELATIWKNQKKWDQAEADIILVKKITERNRGEHPEEYVQALLGYGDIYREQGRYTEGIEMYNEALQVAEVTLGTKSVHVINCLNNLGLSYQYMNQLSEAESYYIRARDLTKETLGEDHPQMATRLHNLAWLAHSRGDFEKALEGYLQSMAIKEKFFGPKHKKLLIGIENIVDVLKNLERWDEARHYQARYDYIAKNFADD